LAQRVLEPGEIETLAQRSIPRIRLPDRSFVFARRAARLRELAEGAAIGEYLHFLAVLVDAQHAASAHLSEPRPTAAHIETAGEYHMPPIHASTWPRSPRWHECHRGRQECSHSVPDNDGDESKGLASGGVLDIRGCLRHAPAAISLALLSHGPNRFSQNPVLRRRAA